MAKPRNGGGVLARTASNRVDGQAGSYPRTTIYLSDEQWRWLSRLAAQAPRLDDLPL